MKIYSHILHTLWIWKTISPAQINIHCRGWNRGINICRGWNHGININTDNCSVLFPENLTLQATSGNYRMNKNTYNCSSFAHYRMIKMACMISDSAPTQMTIAVPSFQKIEWIAVPSFQKIEWIAVPSALFPENRENRMHCSTAARSPK